MFKPKDTKERILHRLKISKGHLDRIIKMVDEDCYCVDILNQSKAVQSALKEADALLLKDYLKGKVKKVPEIMQVFERLN